MARAPGRAATGRSATGAGSDVERDHCGRRLAPADEARPPSAGAVWPPRMAPVEPQWLCMRARVPLAATNCDSLAMVRSGSDGTEVGYGSAKRKYGVGGMDEVWNRKYERDPIRGPIRSCRSMRAWRLKSARDAWGGCLGRIAKLVSDPTSNCSRRQCLDEWAIWFSEGAPVTFPGSMRAAQCATISKENSPYDPTHAAWGPRASGTFRKLP